MDNSCFRVNIGSRKIFLCTFVFPFFPSLFPSLQKKKKQLQPSWERKWWRRRRPSLFRSSVEERERKKPPNSHYRIESREKFEKDQPVFVYENGMCLTTRVRFDSPKFFVFSSCLSIRLPYVIWILWCVILRGEEEELEREKRAVRTWRSERKLAPGWFLMVIILRRKAMKYAKTIATRYTSSSSLLLFIQSLSIANWILLLCHNLFFNGNEAEI